MANIQKIPKKFRITKDTFYNRLWHYSIRSPWVLRSEGLKMGNSQQKKIYLKIFYDNILSCQFNIRCGCRGPEIMRKHFLHRILIISKLSKPLYKWPRLKYTSPPKLKWIISLTDRTLNCMDLPIYVVIFDELILKAGWNIKQVYGTQYTCKNKTFIYITFYP